ncbi:MAG: EAL domain-containing protein [Alphaproteobacteria bacterium]
MDQFDKELLLWVEGLLSAYKRFVHESEGTEKEESRVNGLRGLVNLANSVLRDVPIFGIEPWHVIGKSVPMSMPGEMLLRLKDYKGDPIPPYPFVMAFYETGFTAQLDAILTLAALRQFEKDPSEKQVSINISGISLRDPAFVKMVLGRLEAMDLPNRPHEAVIFEIHESAHHVNTNRSVLELFRRVGVGFALDDVGMTMQDIMRLGEFEGIADFIKIDRHSVLAEPGAPNAMENIVNYVRSMLPGAVLVAEGVQNAQHAMQIQTVHPDIVYAQGLYLPSDRDEFSDEYLALRA